MTRFMVWIEENAVFVPGEIEEIDLIWVWVLKLTCSLCGGQNWPGVCVRAENDLFLVWGSTSLVFVLVVETNLVLYVGRKSLDFSVSIEIEFVFVWVVEIDLI